MFKNTLIGKHVSRTNRNLILANLFLAFSSSMVVCASIPTLVNSVSAPLTMTGTDLAKVDLSDLSNNRVKVTGDAISPPFYEEYEVRSSRYTGKETGRTKLDEFQLLSVNGKFITVKVKNEQAASTVIGALVDVPPEVKTGGLDSFVKDMPELKGKIIPVMVDTTAFDSSIWIMPCVFAILALVGFFNLGKSVMRMLDPKKHPIARNLRKFGNESELARAIENELRTSMIRLKGTDAIVTQNWMLVPSTFDMQFVKIDEVIWFHEKEVVHNAYQRITGGDLYVVVYKATKDDVSIKASKPALHELGAILAERAPWALVGHDDGIERHWKNTRESVIAQILADRERMLNPPSEDLEITRKLIRIDSGKHRRSATA
ncbi:MAG: hypothetical protein K2Z81_18050 [Cyanobacteria bacterium]|nr:hypothetical protein [Cyanobacteriota bacterium]